MKKYIFLAVFVVLIFGYVHQRGISLPGFPSRIHSDDSILQRAYDHKQSDLQVQGEGIVIQILPDDLEGAKHQRFVLKLSSGQTLLVVHNIDSAPRIISLRIGDKVAFYGVYEWNAKGGIIHWTHRDLTGRHIGGWLNHDGKTYQ